MPVNFSADVYLPAQGVFGRMVSFTPAFGTPFSGRGILDLEAIDVQALDSSIVSETRITLDIRDVEFAVLPLQGDLVNVPADSGLPAEGAFEVIDTRPNGGGETTLDARRIVTSKP